MTFIISKKWNYYNDNDQKCCAWGKELIKAGLIPDGEIDDRPIQSVQGDDLREFVQCHFFVGIFGWLEALRLAGFPSDRAVWTGSCPCQPFSAAGRQEGIDDERHLWPQFKRLITECRPSVVFGEQVASKLGREWFANVRTDLETLGYVTGGADLCAAGAGAPHIRQRIYWVADSMRSGLEGIYEAGWRVIMQPTIPPLWGHWNTEPKMDRVAYGIPAKVGRLRGFGNAVVPQIAALFVRSCIDAINNPVISCYLCGDIVSIGDACSTCGAI